MKHLPKRTDSIEKMLILVDQGYCETSYMLKVGMVGILTPKKALIEISHPYTSREFFVSTIV